MSDPIWTTKPSTSSVPFLRQRQSDRPDVRATDTFHWVLEFAEVDFARLPGFDVDVFNVADGRNQNRPQRVLRQTSHLNEHLPTQIDEQKRTSREDEDIKTSGRIYDQSRR